MNTVETPFGGIQIFFDGKPAEYSVYEFPKDIIYFPDVDGRYKISVEYDNDSAKHSICCRVSGLAGDVDIDYDSGERLEALAFRKGEIKMTLAAEGDSYYIGDKRYSDYGYDYDVTYLKDGLQYEILSDTKSRVFVFGVAWINHRTGKNDMQTWFAAEMAD